MKQIVLITALFLSANLFAQDWALFPLNQKSYYQKGNSEFTLEILIMDSIFNDIQYFNKKPLLNISDSCFENLVQYLHPYNDFDSLISDSGIVYYYCEYTSLPFIFNTYAEPGDSWTIESDYFGNPFQEITITCDEKYFGTVLTENDSIKVFSLDAVGTTSSIEDFQVVLSKNHGLIEFISPFQFLVHSSGDFLQYKLIGFDNEESSRGYTLPGWSQFFDLSTGDIKVWKYTVDAYSPFDPDSYKYFKDSVINVLSYEDSLIIYYDRVILYEDGSLGYEYALKEKFSKEGFNTLINSPTNWLAFGNNQYGPYGELNSSVVWFSYSWDMDLSTVPGDTIISNYYYNETHSVDTLNCYVHEYTDTGFDFSINSFSGTTSYCKTDYGVSECQNLIGYNIDGISWGVQYLTTQIANQSVNYGISITPIPAQYSIKINTASSQFNKFFIFNINNQLISSGELSNNQIDISQLQPGIYFLEVADDEKTLRGKFVKM